MPESKRRKKGSGARHIPAGGQRLAGSGAPRPQRRRRRNIRRWLFTAGAFIIAILVIGSFGLTAIPFGGGPRTATNTGPGTRVATIGREHIAQGQSFTGYNTTPPTSGSHWPIPIGCGIYDEELPDEQLVHNLEHGNVVVSYNLTDPAEVDRLKDILKGLNGWSVWGVARPYSKIDEGTVALTAWGYIQQVEGVDEAAIRDFFQAYAQGEAGSPKLGACS